MKVNVFLESGGTFAERELLSKFHIGISTELNKLTVDEFGNHVASSCSLSISDHFSACDVGVILGSWKARDRSHHITRSSVVENSPCFVVVETPLLGRVVSSSNTYFRVGVNGFLNSVGTFHHGKHTSDRFNKLGLTWSGWKHNLEGAIVIMLQLPGDASLRNINLYEWALWCVTELRKYTDTRIIIRTHPAHNIKDTDAFHKFTSTIMLSSLGDIQFSNGKTTKLSDDLANAYCTITYSSGSAIDSILAGIPSIATDPGNFAWELSSNYIEDVIDVKCAADVDVMQWLYNLAYSQWTLAEMKSGEVWRHLLPIVMTNLINLPVAVKKRK